MRILLAIIILLLAVAAYLYYASVTPTVIVPAFTVTAETLAQGEYLLSAGGCKSCHQNPANEKAIDLSGGLGLETPFGVFKVPNITADKQSGIGNWSDADFIRAFRHGVSPDRSHYYPAFPYTSYTGVSDEDLLALKAYLFSLEPVERENSPHELAWYVSLRPLLTGWKFLHFTPGVFQADSSQNDVWNRGAYLVRHLGHCGECHSPRGLTGAINQSHALAGNPHGPDDEAVPDITLSDDGIADWTRSDLESFLEIGMLPDGDFSGGAMSEVIDDNTSQLTAEDRAAIVTYLLSK